MRLDVPVTLIGSALAFYGRPGGNPLQARQLAAPVNRTEHITTALEPLVHTEDAHCQNVLAAIGSDPAAEQCCAYMDQLNQPDPSPAAVTSWLDGFCASPCPHRHSTAAGMVVDGCKFKPQGNVSAEQVAVAFRTAVDVMAVAACVKDSAGNYCIVTVADVLKNSSAPATPGDPAAGKAIIGKLCTVPCGLQLIDAVQNSTGYNSSVACTMASSDQPLPSGAGGDSSSSTPLPGSSDAVETEASSTGGNPAEQTSGSPPPPSPSADTGPNFSPALPAPTAPPAGTEAIPSPTPSAAPARRLARRAVGRLHGGSGAVV